NVRAMRNALPLCSGRAPSPALPVCTPRHVQAAASWGMEPGLQEAQLLQDDELRIAEFGDAERPPGRASVNGFPNRMGKPPGAALGAGGRHQFINCTLGVFGHGKPSCLVLPLFADPRSEEHTSE